MAKERKFSWGSAVVGAAAAAATAFVISSKPREPTFHLISIDLTSFNLNFPSLDAEMILTVHVTNPNIVAVQYPDTAMSIFYSGSLIGSASVRASSQPPRSCQLLRLPARLSGARIMAHHAKKFAADVGRRKMVLDSTVDISAAAKLMWWSQKCNVRLDSHVIVDPVSLHVIDQENKSKLEISHCFSRNEMNHC